MNRHGDLEYALARIGGRMGERPSEASWRALTVIRGFEAFIDAARASSLARWMKGIARQADAQVIEEKVAENGVGLVHEVRDWMPARWQPAIEWTAVLLDLPAALHLARGNSPLRWMRDDASYRKLARAAWLAQGDAAAAMQAWREEWGRRAPHDAANDLLLREFARLIATEPRRSLGPPLLRLYRRATLTPAAALIFLALSALDMERLRGELLRRALFSAKAAA